ncbi:MAG: tetratricopeptide repeat protein [Candidatus Omnitrophica bacterium]|nr:tetratricopeptide repeat protein [Candidatus Omnitrophota bacterium]
MPQGFFLFLRKNIIVIVLVLLVVSFFFIYNTFLVDRSLINLQIALVKLNEAKTIEDLEKIKPLLKAPLLVALSKTATSNKAMAALDMINNIISNVKSDDQIKDIKFYVKSVIDIKEKERGAILSILDNFNTRLFAPVTNIPQKDLESKARSLTEKIKSTKDKDKLQELYCDLGTLLVESGDIEQAQVVFLQVVDLNPKSAAAAKALFSLASAYKANKEYEKAAIYFKKVIEQYYGEKIGIYSKYELADIWFKKGDYQKARDEYASVGAQYPQFDLAATALYEAGYISFYYLNDKDSALVYFNELSQQYPSANIVQHVVKEVRPVMAKEYRLKGFNLLKEKKYPEAVQNFDEAVRISPSDSKSYSGQGLGYYWQDNKQEALNRADRAIESNIQDEVALINSMFIYINSGRIDDAIRVGEMALSRVLVPKAEFYYNLGYAYLLKGEVDKAIAQFERAIRINSDFIFAYNNLGCAFWAKGQFSLAINKYKEAIGIDDSYVNAHYNLGISYFEIKRIEEAYKEFKIVNELNPTEYKEAANYLKQIVEVLKYQP